MILSRYTAMLIVFALVCPRGRSDLAHAQPTEGPRITLSPTTAAAGVAVRVMGTGFLPGDIVYIDLFSAPPGNEGMNLVAATVDENGAFETIISPVLNDWTGQVTIFAYPASFGGRSRETMGRAPRALLTITAAGPSAAMSAQTSAAAVTPTLLPRLSSITPGSLMLPPHREVVFFDPIRSAPDEPPAPSGPRTLEIANESDYEATVTLGGGTLSVTTVAGQLVRFTAGCTGPPAATGTCVAAPQPLASCQFARVACRIVFTTIQTASGSVVELARGCTNLALRFPTGTALDTVATAISPPVALQAIWRYDAAAQRFRGYAPGAGAANDLTTVNDLDAVLICLSAPATLKQPSR